MAAVVLSVGMLATGVTPASAAKKSKDTADGPQACDALDPDATTTLTEIRQVVGADDALNLKGLSGGGIGVAVIDTGVNPVAGLTQPGKVVDGPDLSFDALDDGLRHRDLHGHGTNMAAIIAAKRSASGDGVAPDAHIVNVKVGAADGTVDVSQVIAGIDWVVQNRDTGGHNIRVISLAFDTDAVQSYQLDPLSHAVGNAWNAGIVVVVAGGNDGRSIGRLGNPAINPFVIAVGAAEQKSGGWTVPTWSSTGDGVRNPDVVAPGAAVLSAGVGGSYLADTYPTATCADGGDLYLRGDGTSQAAAVVSGMVALLLEQRPELTPDQVKYLLRSTAGSTNSNSDRQSGEGMAALWGPNANQPGALQAATPTLLTALQTHLPSTGLGSLDAARGSFHVGTEGDLLDGELTAFGGDWDPAVWTSASDLGSAWTDQTYVNGDDTWTGGTWMGASWSGASWSGASWSGASWSGASWSGASWSGASWSGASWSGASWSGASWSGASWS